MFDDEGLWHDEYSHEPSSGAIAGLDIGNAVQSYQNYQRTREAQVLSDMLKMRALGQAGADVAGTPEGGAALSTRGIDPASIESMWQNSPEMKFRGYLSSEEGQNAGPEDIERSAIGLGIPAGQAVGWGQKLVSQGVQQQKAHTAALRELSTTLQKATDSNAQYTDSRRDAAEGAWQQILATHPEYGEDEEMQKNARSWIDSQPEEMGGLMGAKSKELGSRSKREEAQAQSLLETLPDRLNLMNATTVYRQAMAASANARAAHLDGTQALAPKDMLNNSARLEKLAVQEEGLAEHSLSTNSKAEHNKKAQDYRTEAGEWARLAQNPPQKAAGGGGLGKPVGKAPGVKDTNDWTAPNGKHYIVKGELAYAKG